MQEKISARRSIFTKLASLADWLKAGGLRAVSDGIPQLGAALAFYSMLSLAPLLVLTLSVVSWLYGDAVGNQELHHFLADNIGREEADNLLNIPALSSPHQQTALSATILNMLLLLFGASGVFSQLKDTFNRIWRVPARKDSVIWGFIRDKLLSFLMVLSTGVMAIVFIASSAILSATSNFASGLVPQLAAAIQFGQFFAGIGIMTVVFAFVFRMLPATKVWWHDVWGGAALTALLFVIGQFAFGLYLSKTNVTSSYGAAGSLVALLIWVYYTAQIFFFGAELTRVYAERYGSLKDVPQ